MKKLMALLVGVGLMAGVAQGSLVTIDFSIDENWDSDSSLASYADDVEYSEQGWHFLATADALRQTGGDPRIGDYSFRLRGQSFLAQNTTEETYNGFNIWLQPWSTSEPSAATAWTVEYSVDSGADWTAVGSPLQGSDPVEWVVYGATFDMQTFSAGELQVRLTSSGNPTSNDNRISVGQFQAIPEPGTIALLAMGMVGVFAARRKLRG